MIGESPFVKISNNEGNKPDTLRTQSEGSCGVSHNEVRLVISNNEGNSTSRFPPPYLPTTSRVISLRRGRPDVSAGRGGGMTRDGITTDHSYSAPSLYFSPLSGKR